MANIRRIGDYNNRSNGNNYQQMQQPGDGQLPFFMPPQGNPNNENFGSMLISTLCPRIKFFSVTLFIIALIIVLYCSMLGVGGITREVNTSFLLVTEQSLRDFGGNNPFLVKNSFQFYLLFSSLFLAYNFLNLITYCLYLLIFCTSLENSVGPRNTILIYFLGGACGSLLGSVSNCCIQNVYSELPSAIYALIGAYVALLIINWQKLEGLGSMRTVLGCIIFLMFIFVLLFAFGNSGLYTDNMGGLGGFLGGLFLGMGIINVQNSGQYEKNVRLFGVAFLGVFVIVCIILLFTLNYQ